MFSERESKIIEKSIITRNSDHNINNIRIEYDVKILDRRKGSFSWLSYLVMTCNL